jgi:hypothetical protein
MPGSGAWMPSRCESFPAPLFAVVLALANPTPATPAGMLGAGSIGIFLIPMLYVAFQSLREATGARFGGARKGAAEKLGGDA